MGASLPFSFFMTRRTEYGKVAPMVRTIMIRKHSEWYYMMNLNFSYYSTFFAFTAIPFYDCSADFMPFWSTIIVMTSIPCWTFLTLVITRCTLPNSTTFRRTKIMSFHMRGTSRKSFLAYFTNQFHFWFPLMMKFTARAVLFSPFTFALFRAECLGKSSTAKRSHDWPATVRTLPHDSFCSAQVSAPCSAIFLQRMITRGLK